MEGTEETKRGPKTCWSLFEDIRRGLKNEKMEFDADLERSDSTDVRRSYILNIQGEAHPQPRILSLVLPATPKLDYL
jgi:hypothetical protein